MGFGLPNIKQMAINAAEDGIKELEKIDLNHDGIPDIKEAQTLITEGITELEAFEAKISPAEAVTALNLLFPGKFTVAEVTAAEASIGKLLTGITKVQGVISNAKAALG